MQMISAGRIAGKLSAKRTIMQEASMYVFPLRSQMVLQASAGEAEAEVGAEAAAG